MKIREMTKRDKLINKPTVACVHCLKNINDDCSFCEICNNLRLIEIFEYGNF